MRALSVIWAIVSLCACAKSAPPVVPAQSVYDELVDAGCLSATGDGPSSVELAREIPNAPAWLGCLFDGGSVQACGVPCQ